MKQNKERCQKSEEEERKKDGCSLCFTEKKKKKFQEGGSGSAWRGSRVGSGGTEMGVVWLNDGEWPRRRRKKKKREGSRVS